MRRFSLLGPRTVIKSRNNIQEIWPEFFRNALNAAWLWARLGLRLEENSELCLADPQSEWNSPKVHLTILNDSGLKYRVSGTRQTAFPIKVQNPNKFGLYKLHEYPPVGKPPISWESDQLGITCHFGIDKLRDGSPERPGETHPQTPTYSSLILPNGTQQ